MYIYFNDIDKRGSIAVRQATDLSRLSLKLCTLKAALVSHRLTVSAAVQINIFMNISYISLPYIYFVS